jgi:hypothetical protein
LWRCSGYQAFRKELHRHATARLQSEAQNALYHWARVAVQHDPRSRAKYAALRLRGHARALRSVGDRLLNVACAMLRNGTQFNPLLESQKSAC